MSITIFILITLYFTAKIDCLKYRYDYAYHPEIEGWLKQNIIPATWHQARLRCHLEGAELASPIDNGFLKTLKGRSQIPTWTGVHSFFSKGDYSSIEGVPLLRMPISWAPGEPDNHEDKEQCIIMMPNGTFADVCCDEMFPYICFRKKSTSVSVNVACGTVDSRYAYETRTGSCYKFHDHAQTWNRAYMTCEAEGAHLAIMDTAAETQVLKEIISEHPKTKIYGAKYDHVLVGFHDWGDAGVWTTIHGQSIEDLVHTGVINWASGEPNSGTFNGLGQSCGSIRSDGDLYNFWCHVPAAFICEKTQLSLENEGNN
ncbi:hypothetical protein K1T71_006919 [Dendrolimus kikuchii]|uniref:Uncharacterized protein n=1 Tax=Dendrolimus kikuchii TaxID=765133 RepID=A0ACC1CZ54_9NEOP|nr:hypothetical protein K1T71_006919 [Dendrolimus kikuchii]